MTAATIEGPSREETERFIAEATARLKGPLSNVERAWLYADKKDARAYLARIDAAIRRAGRRDDPRSVKLPCKLEAVVKQ